MENGKKEYNKHMLKIWTMNINEIKDEGEEKLLALCTPERRERIARYKVENARLLSLAAGVLESRVLALCPPGTEILLSPEGKPGLSAGGLFYNLSHSGDYAVCAVADAEVGIDLQKPVSLSDALQASIQTDQEKKGGAFRTPGAWFLLWSVKEAYMKLIGKGLSLEFSRLETRWEKGSPTGEIYDLKGEYKPAGFRAETFPGGYSLAVCVYLP